MDVKQQIPRTGTITIVLCLGALALSTIYDRTIMASIDQRLFYILFQAVTAILLATLAGRAIRNFSIERDLSGAKRADLGTIYDSLISNHTKLLEAIHALRASVGYDEQRTAHEAIAVDPKTYEDSMTTLLHCKLAFGSMSHRLRDHNLGYKRSAQLADLLQLIDNALAPLIEEFNAELINVRDKDITTRIQDLPELLDVLKLESKQHPFSPAGTRAFYDATLGMSKARHLWDAS